MRCNPTNDRVTWLIPLMWNRYRISCSKISTMHLAHHVGEEQEKQQQQGSTHGLFFASLQHHHHHHHQPDLNSMDLEAADSASSVLKGTCMHLLIKLCRKYLPWMVNKMMWFDIWPVQSQSLASLSCIILTVYGTLGDYKHFRLDCWFSPTSHFAFWSIDKVT